LSTEPCSTILSHIERRSLAMPLERAKHDGVRRIRLTPESCFELQDLDGAQPALPGLPTAALLRQALACGWWLVRAHVADRHLLPRRDAVEPPPSPWLDGWPRGQP
jgi:hypothetical protein